MVRWYTTPTAAASTVYSSGTDKWVLSWRLNEESDSSGDRRAVGSRFHAGPGAIRSKAAVASRRPSPGHQEGRRHTEVGQVTWRCVVQTLPHQHRRLEDHPLTNWKPMKCLEDRRDVVMTTSAGDQTSCHILYRLEWRRRRWTSATPARSELQ